MKVSVNRKNEEDYSYISGIVLIVCSCDKQLVQFPSSSLIDLFTIFFNGLFLVHRLSGMVEPLALVWLHWVQPDRMFMTSLSPTCIRMMLSLVCHCTFLEFSFLYLQLELQGLKFTKQAH